MSFCYEEHFPSYESSDFFTADDESQSVEELFNNSSNAPYWDWEMEQEINGDIALIPMSSNIGMNYLSNSPPAREDFQKIMSEWQHFMNSEVSELDAFSTGISLTDMCENISETEHIPSQQLKKMPHFSGKKIDLNAQCYIINERENDKPHIDEETEENLNSVSEEAINDKVKTEDVDSENDFVDVDTVSDINTPILQAGDLNSLLEQFEATESFQPEASAVIKDEVVVKEEFEMINCEPESESVDKNKQILDALPQELIMKIKASSKRRVVPVIDAIPTKKRSKKMQNELVTSTSTATQEVADKPMRNESIQLDHDYCNQSTPYPKHPQKDSGFESAEEDEQRSIFKKQPTVKGADGKLMVSLLKVNTIRNSIVTENNKTKRKLNLEEYKKRREGIIRVNTDSHCNSPTSSGENSPVVEDEHIRLLKHQQKLMQMAEEVLKTPPKSVSLSAQNNVAETSQAPATPAPTTPPTPPSNIEVKTLVSMGVNTIVSSQVQPSELEDIKPILQSANAKINDNSLITSVIKSIQKLKTNVVPETNNIKEVKDQEHGEDKTILYLDKRRPPIETRNVEVQTEPEVEDTTKHKRKRNSSASSSSSEHGEFYKRRSGSNDSHYSYSSRSSSASSRSRSRSRSPRRTYSKKRLIDIERERISEVEERRIVYVGGISSSTSKDNLRRRFQMFGPITNVSVHFREYGDNYGFVTYVYKTDAYKAVEHGNDDPMLPKYDLSFGGRRIFCRTHYSDLDNMQDDKMYPSQVDDSFDNLLREAKAKLRKRKSCT